jgi:hypothetical protein
MRFTEVILFISIAPDHFNERDALGSVHQLA